jgi:transposase
VCGKCSVIHDRDVCSVENIESAARSSPSVGGN